MWNIHPIIVHFPVALLTIYALLEIASLHPRLAKNTTLFYIKIFLLLVGSAGTIAGILSGEGAERIAGRSSLVHTHEEFAEMTRNIFVVLSLIYLSTLYTLKKDTATAKAFPPFLQKFLTTVSKYAKTMFIPLILALLGLGTLTITGALGGAMAHGKNVDPVAKRAVDTFVK